MRLVSPHEMKESKNSWMLADTSVGVPRPPMSSQGEGQEGVRRRLCTSTAACGATRCDCHCEGCATAAMRAAERHLHLCACRACRCREEVQATSHHWAAEAVFPLYPAGEATLLAGDVLFCIDAPNGLSRRRVVAVQLSCSSLHTWLPVAWLICRAIARGPPLGGCSLVFLKFCVLLRCAGEQWLRGRRCCASL
ncbi:hypothetical protein TcCL_NonESM12262 [Trypanosoma cruzi]|uniref:Uncharacterized protein n=1 Tax=Trypanosoma cruzi (strain CL Brener) TaxID=353153 RepID=Q4D7C2_TRYCC|nr:hypothetical protein Tc00.1047053511237.120 [Trypanosoma cruzi]EAN88433.1 hypothetical protein Tc00.1047053511237.120 [Trypanosoma cruzi]RNC38485.1 hypothetical protein TcCL_NonESM12262 [Trypanosoma cruzi]|eukprot:XP_810284.1 hypothetical protein [Trypanosoma cruzi strain CL Brener]